MPANNPRIPYQLLTERPTLAALNGRPLMVHIVMNLEVWPFDKPMPRAILQNPHGKTPMPDIGNYSWVEYGLRTAVPRLERILSARKLPVTNMPTAMISSSGSTATARACVDGRSSIGAVTPSTPKPRSG